MEYQLSNQQADDYLYVCERGKTDLQRLKRQMERQRALEEISEERTPPKPAPLTLPKTEAPQRDPDWVPQIGDLVFVPELRKEATLIKFTSKNKAVIRTGFLTITVESASLQPLAL